MTTPSDRIGLAVPDDDDAFVTEDLAANWGKVDAYMGHFVVASALPGTWDTDQTGLKVWQVDTGLSWTWNGTQFERTAAKGHLGGDSVDSDVVAAVVHPTVVTVVEKEVDVPRGGRRVEVTVNLYDLTYSAGATRSIGVLKRDATVLQEWSFGTGSRSITWLDNPGEGTFTYTFAIGSDTTGTTTVEAAPDRLATIDVVEV